MVGVTDAFIDRAPIDWMALRSRARPESERAIIQGLWSLDRIREAARRELRIRDRPSDSATDTDDARPAHEVWSLTSVLVRLLILLAAGQVFCSFVLLGAALVNGETISTRTPQIVLALAFTAASLFLAVAVSRDPRRLYLLGFFSSAACTFSTGALTGLSGVDPGATTLVFDGLLPRAFMPASLWQFAVAFPRVRRFTPFDVLARRATTGTWLLGTLLFGVNWLSTYYPVHSEPLAYLLYTHPSKTFIHLSTLMLIPPLAIVFVRSHRAPLSERRKIARLAFIITAGIGPLLLFHLARIVWPGIDAWLLTNGLYQVSLALISAALAATPILTTAVIIVDRPLDLQSVLHRASRYALARSVLTILVVAPFIVLFVMLYDLRHVAIADLFAGPRAWLLLSCSVVGCLLLLARSALRDTLDRHLSRRAADHSALLARSLERVRLARGLREIIVTVTRELREGIGAETVHLLVPTGRDAFVDLFTADRRLPRDGAVVAMLEQADTPVDLSFDGPLVSLLPKDDRDWVAANDVELAAALTTRDGTLSAIALVGAKRGGLSFDARDRWFVSALITAAAAAWDSNRRANRPVGASARGAMNEDEAALECQRCGVVGDPGPLPCSCRAGAVLALLPRRVRERFFVQRRLGAGGMGVVYLARDTALDRDVALKTLPCLGKHRAAGLREEARAMAALSHESLAVIYDLYVWHDTPVLVVEYLPNGTLARRLVHGPLASAATLQLGLALARALTYVHARGVLHRDLKPSNIAFAATGVPKLLDFGLATLMPPSSDLVPRPGPNTTLGAKPPLAGTRAYLPPEAYEGAPATAAFDLWALAVVMLEAMTGVNPFAAADQIRPSTRRADRTSVNLHPYLSDLTPALRGFFERALNRRPDRRFQTGLDLHAALQDAARWS